jgi:alpha-glucosidase (family GH31 glycosyl hydrolase)
VWGASASCGRTDPGTAAPTGDAGGTTAGSTVDSSSSGSSAICANVEQAVPPSERVSNGHPLLPPKWAFGVLWGSYYDQTGLYATSAGVTPPHPLTLPDAAAKIRNEYAGDLMWVDSTWLYDVYGSSAASTGPYYLCFTYDATTFPDPVAMIQGLRALHFHYGTWTWPWMGHGCRYFDDAVANGYFVMNGAVPALASGGWHGDPTPAAFDFTNPATVTWWQGLMKPYTDAGQDFFKLDTNQTQVVSWQGSGGALSDPTEDYVHAYHQAEYDASKLYAAANDPNAATNGARGFILPKQHAPDNDQIPGWWTDDTATTFAGMQTEMSRAAALDTPDTAAYWCGDTGGYGGAAPSDELYARWLEYSTFTPLQEFFGERQSPGSLGSRWPWLFSAASQSIQKEYASLRYRLLPFRYSNAQSAYHETPLVYPVRWVGGNQMISGNGTSDILVQPIIAAGQTTTAVALPAGSDWIHYWTGKSYVGGSTATVATPIDQAAVFVKAGSIIPMGPDQRYVGDKPADPLTLDIYPAGSTSYTLYEDDGISEGYLGGAYSTTVFHAGDTGGHVTVSIDPQVTAKYTYAGQLCSRGYILEIHGQTTPPAGVTRDGHVVMSLASSTALDSAVEGYSYDGLAQIVWVKFQLDSGQATTASLD